MKSLQYWAIAVGLLASAVDVEAAETPLGTEIRDFTLHDYLGTKHSLADRRDKKVVVIAFLGVECPLAKHYGSRLAELATKYQPQGVAFMGIDANQQDSLAEIAHFARAFKIDFPILRDPGNIVADQCGAQRTPEVFVVDAQRIVRYWGRIDDQYGVGYARPAPTKSFVADALDDLLAGKKVREPAQKPVGCFIGRVQRAAPTGEVTYTKHIASILHQRCVRCHRSGEVAPFPLSAYDEVVGWAETIREVIADGRMPPWHASPEHGEFSNDIRLPEHDKDLIDNWIKNGCPQGNAADLPTLAPFVQGWQIPKPDVVYRMPQPFVVAAKGIVPYQYFYLDPKFEDDVWIQGAEIRPGNRAVVHHIAVFFLPPGQTEPRAEDPPFNAVAAFAPGMPAGLWPAGHARLIPAGSKLGFQVHYTPNGSPQSDRSEVGLVFADPRSVKKEVKFGIAANLDLRISPGAADHVVPASYQFTQDTFLHAMIPHMHYRGKSFRYTAQYPDGASEILLDIPRYDFNWQNAYILKKSKLMPKGTVLSCAAHFDNSAKNLLNPDPTKEVTWGDQTWDEMMLGAFVISLPESTVAAEFPRIEDAGGNVFNVAFRYRPEGDQPAVTSVYLAGSFNDWNPTAHLMTGPDKDGWFRTTLHLNAGHYEYKFVLNGKTWTHDPGNPNQNGPFNNGVIRVRPTKKQ